MTIKNFFQNRKIKNVENEAYKYYLKTFKAVESDSVKVVVNKLNKGEAVGSVMLLEDVKKSMETMEQIEQKYVRLKEKFKHESNQLLNIVIDWRDFNLLNYNLFTHKITANPTDYEIRAQEMIKRFDRLLEE